MSMTQDPSAGVRLAAVPCARCVEPLEDFASACPRCGTAPFLAHGGGLGGCPPGALPSTDWQASSFRLPEIVSAVRPLIVHRDRLVFGRDRLNVSAPLDRVFLGEAGASQSWPIGPWTQVSLPPVSYRGLLFFSAGARAYCFDLALAFERPESTPVVIDAFDGEVPSGSPTVVEGPAGVAYVVWPFGRRLGIAEVIKRAPRGARLLDLPADVGAARTPTALPGGVALTTSSDGAAGALIWVDPVRGTATLASSPRSDMWSASAAVLVGDALCFEGSGQAGLYLFVARRSTSEFTTRHVQVDVSAVRSDSPRFSHLPLVLGADRVVVAGASEGDLRVVSVHSAHVVSRHAAAFPHWRAVVVGTSVLGASRGCVSRVDLLSGRLDVHVETPVIGVPTAAPACNARWLVFPFDNASVVWRLRA